MRGRLIAVEGLDGVGKTTLSRALAEALGGVWLTTPGPWVRANCADFDAMFAGSPEARSLAYAATVMAVGREAEAIRARGQDVVIDRYWLSTLVYAPPTLWEALDLASVHVSPADCTLLLEAPEETRRDRLQGRGALSPADLATLEPGRARWLTQRYLAFAHQLVTGVMVPVDAEAEPPEVLQRAIQALGLHDRVDVDTIPGWWTRYRSA